ncbi:hypothetical protein [Microterricola viridarii]|uniref:hypothetical protein n=1 Tax=Microterricola viridarii TaxID=412690 RepID=UPI0018FF688F|nr:hypothetical protein [Microterricola viridarii]
MGTENREALRSVSQAAFGQQHRLELMLCIANAEDGIFSLTELAKALDVTMSSLQRPMDSLLATQLISALPDADSKYRYYTRNPSAAWAWAHELAQQADEVEAVGTELTRVHAPR